MKYPKIIIAIDGFSSTGKSTIAKKLAKKLQYIYVDSGAMYRAVTLFGLQKQIINEKKIHTEKLKQSLVEIELTFKWDKASQNNVIYLNNVCVEKEIRTLEVSNWVSQIAKISEVRSKLVEQQKAMGRAKGIVMDGRDIGTVVFPDAELKIFMNASPESRAQRRYLELKNRGDKITLEQVTQNILSRDSIDANREDSPLIMAPNAWKIDNTNMTIEQQVEEIMNHLLVNQMVKL